jgi:beta-lactamase class D
MSKQQFFEVREREIHEQAALEEKQIVSSMYNMFSFLCGYDDQTQSDEERSVQHVRQGRSRSIQH